MVIMGSPPSSPNLAQGDFNCDGVVNGEDALLAGLFEGNLPFSQIFGCPDLNSPLNSSGAGLPDSAPVEGPEVFGDANCDGEVNFGDGIEVLKWIAGLPNDQEDPCKDIGSPLVVPVG